MGKFTQILFLVMCIGQFTYAQTEYVSLDQVSKVADQKALTLWGNVYSSEPLAYYSKNDELIGYRFTYAINQPFPEKNLLLKQCKEASSQSNHKAQWGIEDFGNIFVSARKDIAVIQDYSKMLSPEYAFGLLMLEKAREHLGATATLDRAYYVNFQHQWFCYSNGKDEVFIKVFPETKVVNREEFHRIVDAKSFFCSQGDFSVEWAQFLGGQMDAPTAQVWIPNHDGNCKYYDWSYGCSPTAAAMLLSYWDYVSSISSNNYSKLVDYYFQRWDGIQGETDYQVPNTNRELAIAMGTDTVVGGGTDRNNIAPGYTAVCNTTNSYNFTCTQFDWGLDYVAYFNKIASEVGTYDRPIHISIPDHSECCVAYDAATNMIGVHNTWYEGVQWISRTQLERVYTIVPGGAEGYAIELTYPMGDVLYNHNGSGETLYAGDVSEIRWSYDYAFNSYVRIYYSTNGGYNWSAITYDTPNDGSYDWVIPSGINSTTCRIRVLVYSSTNVFSGSDASIGNLKILSGGSIPELAEDLWTTASTDPDYFQFTSTGGYWNVVGVRPNISGEDWDISLYGDLLFSALLASSAYGGSTVDFVLLDGNHTPSAARGIKLNRYSGSNSGRVEWEGGTDIITVGSPINETWTTGDVVEMWDAWLTPGYYKCTMLVNSGTADMGMALYGSSGAAYYAGRANYLAMADSYGAGADESFWINITTSDYYGLCIFAKDANTANITVKFETPGQWLGTISNDWFTEGNWSAAFVPETTTDVTINTGYTYYPIISSGAAYCNNISIGPGAKISIGSADLYVAGNMSIDGQAEQTHYNADFYVTGNVYWESGSTANITENGEFHVDGDWEFRNGSAAVLANGYVYFEGAASYSYIRNYEANSAFKNVLNDKTAGYLYFSSASTDTLKINGYYDNANSTSLFYFNTNSPLLLKGQLYNTGHIYCPYGTFIFDGTAHSIDLNTGDYFNDIIISSSGNVSLSDSLRLNGNLTINSGALVTNNYPVFIGKDWNNYVGTSGFNEGTGKVVFNGGNYHQYCSNETFNVLEVNKASGGAFRMDGTHVVCASYDWTAGAVDVLTGSFTANNLLDGSIRGAFYNNTGGTINLNSAYVDLGGELHNFGGTYNITGGVSWWPFGHDAAIEMTGGVIDLTSCGIYIYNSGFNSLTDNITGGTIRTAYGFSGHRADFTPTAGTFEFYGSGDAYLYQSNGCTLPNVNINKSAKGTDDLKAGAPLTDARSGEIIAPGSKSNSILLDSDFKITNNLMISAGSFILNGYQADIDKYCDVYGSLVMTNSADELFVGTDSYDNLEFHTGSNSTLTAGQIYPASWVWSSGAAIVNGGTGNTIHFLGSNVAGMDVDGPGSVFGNVNINKTSGNFSIYSYTWTPIELAGNMDLAAGNVLDMQNRTFIVHGNATDNATSAIYLYDYPGKGLNNEIVTPTGKPAEQGNGAKGGSLTIDTDFTLNGLLDIADGSVLVHGEFSTASTGSVLITTGSFIGDSPNHPDKGWEYLYGNLTMSGGLFELTNNSIHFNSTATTSISGGTLRTGGAFSASNPGNFLPTGGVVEVTGDLPDINIYCGNGNYFHNLLINRLPGVISYLKSYDIIVNSNLTVNSGELDLYIYSASIYGGITLNGGVLNVPSYSNLLLAGGTTLNVNSGGTLRVVGSPANPAIVSRISTGNYTLNVNSGGTIAAQDATFEYMDANGVNLLAGSLVDPDYSFRRCTFRNGPAGGTLLKADNSESIIIRDAVFPTNAGGGATNVTKTPNTGHVYFLDYTGVFSGESFDNDTWNLIDWVAPLTASATATPGTICGGTSTQLDITQAGGVAPFAYIWSPTAGLSDPAIKNPVATPPATTTYNVTVTDFIGTEAYSSILVTVIPATPVSVSIVASANPSPPGNYVTFTATPVGGGTSPSYQWQVNGANVGSGLSTYSYVPTYGNHVRCYLTSNAICPTPNPAESNTITMAVVVTNQTVSGTIPSPSSICFDASNTVTVAGGGNTFLVETGASATIIAGVMISILPTTTVEPAGYLHGYITRANEYCGSLPPAMVATVTGVEYVTPAPLPASMMFTIFPNPTTGIFTIQNRSDVITGTVQVEIFNMRGDRIFSTSFTGERSHLFTLSGLPPGLHFVKVISGDHIESFKLIIVR